MAQYELIVLGSPSNEDLSVLGDRLAETAKAFGMTMPDDLIIRTAKSMGSRKVTSSTAALYFGSDPAVDAELVDELEAARVPIIPVVPVGASVSASVPAEIAETNAFFADPSDKRRERLSAVALEVLGLLRRQRRVFISYRRDDSREAAVQIHDELSARGFDVFLDTHDILPGDLFQEMLWHRLADCDVVIMLDTKDYFGSKWTKQELGRSLAQGIHILRIVWPGHTPSRHLSLSDTVQLEAADLHPSKRLADPVIKEIIYRTESLRSRSVATRHRDIAGTLRIEVERLGGKFEGIGAHRAMSLTLPNGLSIQAYPVVGVPTAELLNDVHEKALAAGHGRFPCLVYDHHGIRPTWMAHLKWLDSCVREVRALKVFDAAWELAAWDS